MTTLKQLERHWKARAYGRLLRDLLTARPEAEFSFDSKTALTARAAAITLIRLDELSQTHAPLASTLIRTLITTQEADGGWSDPATTALCLRALFCDNGSGESIRRGLAYLANLQKPEGIWPAEPLRRMPADASVSAFILQQLGDNAAFRSALNFDAALSWFVANERSLDAAAAAAWTSARLRCRSASRTTPAFAKGMELAGQRILLPTAKSAERSPASELSQYLETAASKGGSRS